MILNLTMFTVLLVSSSLFDLCFQPVFLLNERSDGFILICRREEERVPCGFIGVSGHIHYYTAMPSICPQRRKHDGDPCAEVVA